MKISDLKVGKKYQIAGYNYIREVIFKDENVILLKKEEDGQYYHRPSDEILKGNWKEHQGLYKYFGMNKIGVMHLTNSESPSVILSDLEKQRYSHPFDIYRINLDTKEITLVSSHNQ